MSSIKINNLIFRNFINNLLFQDLMNEVLFGYKGEITDLQLDLIHAAVDVTKGKDIGARVGNILGRAHLVSDSVFLFAGPFEDRSDAELAQINKCLDALSELHRASFDLAHKYGFAIRYQ